MGFILKLWGESVSLTSPVYRGACPPVSPGSRPFPHLQSQQCCVSLPPSRSHTFL